MASKAKKKPEPQPEKIEIETVPVAMIEATLRGSDLMLADGTMLAVTPRIHWVRKAVNKTDADGRPIYMVQGQLDVAITVSGSTGPK